MSAVVEMGFKKIKDGHFGIMNEIPAKIRVSGETRNWYVCSKHVIMDPYGGSAYRYKNY